MTRGFSLIELMLALAIGSVLSGILYMCLFQSQRVADSIETITNIQMRALIARRQLVRDISGAFIPTHILEPKKEKKDSSNEQQEQKKPSDQKEKNDKKEDLKKAEDPKALQEEQKQDIKKALAQAFNGTVDDTQFKQLNIITNNPLEIYWSNKSGRPKFRAEKVMYTLEQEKTKGPPSFKLMRSTTYPKGEKGTETIGANELVSGIKTMSVSYIAIIEEQEREDKKSEGGVPAKEQQPSTQPASVSQAEQEKKEKKKELKTFGDWAVQGMNEDDVRLQNKVPNFVTITLELWAPARTKSESFIFTVPVMWQEIKHKPKKQEQQKQQQQQKAQKSGVPGMQGLGAQGVPELSMQQPGRR